MCVCVGGEGRISARSLKATSGKLRDYAGLIRSIANPACTTRLCSSADSSMEMVSE